MGLLDDLERESAQRRAVGGAPTEEPKEGLWTERLGPAVQRLYEYLKKLTAHLTFLKRRIRVSFSLPGYGDVIAYIDPVYSLKATPSNDSVEIVLECFAQVASDECPVLDVEGVVRVETLSSTFSKHRIAGLQEGRKNANGDVVAGRFQARGRIPLRLLIEAGQSLGVARLTLSNFYGFATTIRSTASRDTSPTRTRVLPVSRSMKTCAVPWPRAYNAKPRSVTGSNAPSKRCATTSLRCANCVSVVG